MGRGKDVSKDVGKLIKNVYRYFQREKEKEKKCFETRYLCYSVHNCEERGSVKEISFDRAVTGRAISRLYSQKIATTVARIQEEVKENVQLTKNTFSSFTGGNGI